MFSFQELRDNLPLLIQLEFIPVLVLSVLALLANYFRTSLTYILCLYNIYTMTEQVIFKIDKKLKEQAMRKARKDGLPLSTVLKRATQAYIDDEFDIGVSYSPKLIRDVRQAQREVREGKVFKGDLDELLKKI